MLILCNRVKLNKVECIQHNFVASVGKTNLLGKLYKFINWIIGCSCIFLFKLLLFHTLTIGGVIFNLLILFRGLFTT